MTEKRKRTLRKLKQLRAEIADYKATLNVCYAAHVRGIARWQAATGKTLTWPDGANLVVWLLERLEHAETVIDAARLLGGKIISNPTADNESDAMDFAMHVLAYDEAGKVKP